MKMLRSAFSWILLLLFISCSSGTETKEKVSTTTDSIPAKDEFQKGVVLDSVSLRNEAAQSYSLYLPSGYQSGKSYPLVVALDPDGSGKTPVDLYKELAERFGFIIAGSNNSSNKRSWPEANTIVERMITDLNARLHVNTQRIYLLGFSGGARIANAYTKAHGNIQGAILCGAAFPAAQVPSRNNYSLAIISGTSDFNYIEMRKYDMIELAGYNVKRTMIEFEGKHAWPPAAVVDEAWWYMEMNEMRKTPSYKNEKMITDRLAEVKKENAQLKKDGDDFKLYKATKKAINFYGGVADVSELFADWKSLEKSKEVDRALKKEEKLWGDEEKMRGEYTRSLQTQDLNWWKKEIASLHKKSMSKADKDVADMHARLREYLSVMLYIRTSATLKQSNLQAADHFSQLYLLVDPENKEAIRMAEEIKVLKGK
jgi:poly(3-hydroxybutyrate) depolymerase